MRKRSVAVLDEVEEPYTNNNLENVNGKYD